MAERTAAASVLMSREILHVIFSFQGGIYQDMRIFYRLPKQSCGAYLYLVYGHQTDNDFTGILRIFASWYASYPVQRLQLLLEHLPIVEIHAWVDAAASGNLAALKELVYWRKKCSIPIFKDSWKICIVTLAASRGHMLVLEFLHRQDLELEWTEWMEAKGWTQDVMNQASAYGQLEVVKWLSCNRNEGCTVQAMNGAAAHGHLHIVEWLHLNRPEGCTTDAMDLAAAGGHMQVMQWLHANRTEGCSIRASVNAARYGHASIMEWLVCTYPRKAIFHRAMEHAARYGHIDVLEVLMRARLDENFFSTFTEAVGAEQTETLRWLCDRLGKEGLDHGEIASWQRPQTLVNALRIMRESVTPATRNKYCRVLIDLAQRIRQYELEAAQRRRNEG